MTGHKTTKLSDAIRNLIVCDTQFGWNGATTLKLPELLDLQARGWLIEGDENNEFSLTVEGEAVIARALRQALPAELAEQQGESGEWGGSEYYRRLLLKAVEMLTKISIRLGLEPNSDGVEPILAAIDALAATGKQQVGEVHPDDLAVDAFATSMKAKMAAARAKGRGGWEDPAQCSANDLSRLLRDHVEKGDPRDVANFCMMLHQRGEAIAAQVGEVQGDARTIAQALRVAFRHLDMGSMRVSHCKDAAIIESALQEVQTYDLNAAIAALAAPQPGAQETGIDGYQRAFYELASMMGMTAQPISPKEVWETQMRPALQAAIAAQGPVPMVLYCPRCHVQHVDAPDERTPDWQNPPHRSHLCHGCGLIWRPADVPTIGVERTQTVGRGDTPFTPARAGEQAPIGYANPHNLNDTSTDGVVLRKRGEFFTVPVYVAPPAQGIDLGQQQDAVRWRAIAPLLSVEWDEDDQLKRWTWLDFKGDAPNIPSPTRQEYTSVDEAVDAMIEQRDAAPGVGNG